jgi:hypothetical protein
VPSKGAPKVGSHPPTRHHIKRLWQEAKKVAATKLEIRPREKFGAREAIRALSFRTVSSSEVRPQQGAATAHNLPGSHTVRLHRETVPQQRAVSGVRRLLEGLTLSLYFVYLL